MALLDFKGKAQAEAWKNRLEELNDETQKVLNDVSSCIDEIKTESTGDPVEQLVITAADMVDAAAEVIKGLRGLESAIQNVINWLIQAIADASQTAIDNRNRSSNF